MYIYILLISIVESKSTPLCIDSEKGPGIRLISNKSQHFTSKTVDPISGGWVYNMRIKKKKEENTFIFT